MIGLTRGTVSLEEHCEEWHALFDEERQALEKVLAGRNLTGIQHVGSTAICGIPAKPILDIIVGTRAFDDCLTFVADLTSLGYEYKGENGVPGRHFFGKGVPRTVHLNVVEYGGDFWQSHIAFRDYIQENSDAALEYEHLKRGLAARFADDRESYTMGKVDFVKRILSLARHE